MDKKDHNDAPKDSNLNFDTNWYALWMKQSQTFFDLADKNLKGLFGKEQPVNPKDHLQQIHTWLDMLKNQWRLSELTEQQKAFADYWSKMAKMSAEAADMLLKEWIKRSSEKNPVKNTRELYEIWLNCCNEIYEKATHSPSYQDTYSELMNATLKYWKSMIPK